MQSAINVWLFLPPLNRFLFCFQLFIFTHPDPCYLCSDSDECSEGPVLNGTLILEGSAYSSIGCSDGCFVSLSSHRYRPISDSYTRMSGFRVKLWKFWLCLLHFRLFVMRQLMMSTTSADAPILYVTTTNPNSARHMEKKLTL